MRVLLKRKLAECIDGVDLSGHKVGDVLELPSRKARLLMAEEWASLERRTAPPGRERRHYLSQASDRSQPDFERRVSMSDRRNLPLAKAAEMAPRVKRAHYKRSERDAKVRQPARRTRRG
jgi:hypothetical protein